MSERRVLLAIWFLACLVVIFVTMQLTSASYVGGQYVPVGHDSFYHARRILDAVASGRVFEFDPLMHVPEGDWVSWPWAYDFVIAQVARIVMLVTGSSNPVAIMVHLPPLLGVVAVSLMIGICAELRVPAKLVLVAALCFALHAYTEFQFGVGSLDHHGAEQVATLGALWLGLRWLGRPESNGRAGTLGLWLGLVLGIHTALFILQLPLLLALGMAWLQGRSPPRRPCLWLAAGIVAGSLCILLPSATFGSARFDVYYLSWLQLYVSVCAGTVVAFMAYRQFSRTNFLMLGTLCVALALPLLSAVAFSRGFLSGDLATIGTIDEIRSPYSIARDPDGMRRINQIYTLLIWTAPVAWLLSAFMAVREGDVQRKYFWVACVFGLTLVPLQLRLASLGIFYLYLPLVVVAGYGLARWPAARPLLWAGLVGSLAIAYYPTLRYQLFGPNMPAADIQFATLQPLIPVLQEACAKDPGVVLAEPGDGHLIRYFTNCSVIGNNFRLTALDVAKVRESLDLIAMPLDQVRQRAPQVKYVIARLLAPIESPDPVLFKELLGSGKGRGTDFDAIAELQVAGADGKTEKFLGVYRLKPLPIR